MVRFRWISNPYYGLVTVLACDLGSSCHIVFKPLAARGVHMKAGLSPPPKDIVRRFSPFLCHQIIYFAASQAAPKIWTQVFDLTRIVETSGCPSPVTTRLYLGVAHGIFSKVRLFFFSRLRLY